MHRYVFALPLLAACTGEPSKGDSGCPDGEVEVGGECRPEQEGDADADSDSDSDADSDADADADSDADCDVTVLATDPTEGDAGVSVESVISWTLSAPDPSARASLEGAGGSSSVDGAIVTFTPSSELDGETAYTAALSWCGDAAYDSFSFTTGPAPEPGSPSGRTYRLDGDEYTLLEPAGMEAILASYYETTLLFEFQAESGGEIDVVWSGEDADFPETQELCGPTETTTVDYSAAPEFSWGPGEVEAVLDGYPLRIEQLSFSGTVSDDASEITDGWVYGYVDTRTLVDLVNPGGDDDVVCELMAGFGVSCLPCSDGAVVCLEFEATDVRADEISANLDEVEGACHPDCQEGDGECISSDCGSCAAVDGRGGLAALLGLLAVLGLRRRQKATAAA